MKFITQLKDDVEFLSMTYACAEKAMIFLDKTEILKIRQTKPKNLPVMPKLPDNFKHMTEAEKETVLKERAKISDEIEKAINSQMLENIKKILFNVCKKHPKEFVELVRMMIVLEDGEDYPHGVSLLTTALSMLTSEEMIGFFTQLTLLGQAFTVK